LVKDPKKTQSTISKPDVHSFKMDDILLAN